MGSPYTKEEAEIAGAVSRAVAARGYAYHVPDTVCRKRRRLTSYPFAVGRARLGAGGAVCTAAAEGSGAGWCAIRRSASTPVGTACRCLATKSSIVRRAMRLPPPAARYWCAPPMDAIFRARFLSLFGHGTLNLHPSLFAALPRPKSDCGHASVRGCLRRGQHHRYCRGDGWRRYFSAGAELRVDARTTKDLLQTWCAETGARLIVGLLERMERLSVDGDSFCCVGRQCTRCYTCRWQ